MEKSPHLNCATQFLMVYVPIMFLSEWREFSSAPCLAGKNLGISRLTVIEIARVD